MGDWVDAFFHFKPTVFNGEMLAKMDRAFARIGYLPVTVSVSIPGHPKIPPAERAAFLAQAASLPTMISVGYSLTGEVESTIFQLQLFPHNLDCMTRLWLATHKDSYYFRAPEILETDSAISKQEDQERMLAAEAAVELLPILHSELGSFYTELRSDYSETPMAVLGHTREYRFPMSEENLAEKFWFYETLSGQWLCPVCFEECGTIPPWSPANNASKSHASGSHLPCPVCGIRFGIDDADFSVCLVGKPNPVGVWDNLRRVWFGKAGKSSS